MAGKATDLVEYESMLLGRHFTMTARAVGGEGRLDNSSYVLLTRIRVEGPLSLRRLSESFGLDVSTLNRKTGALVRRGLLERISDAEGGIARKFRLTEEGQHLLDTERATLIRGLDRLLADWEPEEVAEFAAYLNRFNTTIERMAGRPWPRPTVGEAPEAPEGPDEPEVPDTVDVANVGHVADVPAVPKVPDNVPDVADVRK